jgi:hypothetical protein
VTRSCPAGRAKLLALLVAGVGGASATLSACRQEAADTAVLLEVYRLPETPAPERLLVTWLDQRRLLLRDQTVPTTGTLDPLRVPLATVMLEVPAPGADLERRVLVQGVAGGRVVSQATGRLTVRPNEWLLARMGLGTDTPDDGDLDGIPDEIDNCEGDDRAGCDGS